jgi:hypothetical protein
MQQGWRLLSSEVNVVDAQEMVLPGLQQLKLWHDAAVTLDLAWQQLPPVRRGLKRYALLLPDMACCEHSVPLRCVYGLRRAKEGSEGDGEPAPAHVVASSSLGQKVALLSLRNHAFHPRVYRGMGAESQLFLRAETLARCNPVHWLGVPDGVEPMRAALAEVDLLDPVSMQFPSDTRQEEAIDD